MSDIEKLKALLEGFGIRFFEGEDPKTENLFIRCKEGDEKVDGYALFFTKEIRHETR